MYIMYTMIEETSISQFRNRLADFIDKLRHRENYRVQLLDRRRPVVTLKNVASHAGVKKANSGRALLSLARKFEKKTPKDVSTDISSHVNRYLYGS